MEDANMGAFVDVPDADHQSLSDALASTSYEYEKALIDYQAALGTREPGRQAEAESRLREALRRMSEAQTTLAAARARATQRTQRPTFDDLLYDPTQQLDAAGEVMASVLAYGAAVPTTSSASSAWSATHATREFRAAMYVQERFVASFGAATIATAPAS